MKTKTSAGASPLNTCNSAQDVPQVYQEVLKTLGKKGDYKEQVLKVNLPRNDF